MLNRQHDYKLICENETTMVFTTHQFPHHAYMQKSTAENNFLLKLNDSTLANKDNPAVNLDSAIQLEMLNSRDKLCSARVDSKHRVICILRSIPELNRLIILFITDDENHDYERALKKITASFSAKGFACNSKGHWNEIKGAIINGNYLDCVKAKTASQPVQTTQTKPKEMKAPDLSKSLFSASRDLASEAVATMSETAAQSLPPAVVNEEIVKPVVCHVEAEIETKAAPTKKKGGKKKPANSTAPADLLIACELKPQEENQLTGAAKLVVSLLKQMTQTEDLARNLKIFMNFDNNISVELFQHVLNLGINPNISLYGNHSLMTIAVEIQNKEIIELLIDRGARVNHAFQRFGSILDQAISLNVTSEILDLLIQTEIEKHDINRLQDPHGKTLLHVAISCKNIHAFKELIKSGAKLDIQDKNGKTVIDLIAILKAATTIPADLAIYKKMEIILSLYQVKQLPTSLTLQ